MLRLSLPLIEGFNEQTNEFFTIEGTGRDVILEHSLVSLAEWEADTEKPFLTKDLTYGDLLSYIPYMCLTEGVPKSAWRALNTKSIDSIQTYMFSPRTATKKVSMPGGQPKGNRSGRFVTAELIYSQMFALGIPIECERWHINRLMTLIEVCAVEKMPKKKMKQKDVYAQYAALNAARRAKTGSKG